jgi:epoxyqueuosine reductase
MPISISETVDRLRATAAGLSFDQCRIASAALPEIAGERLHHFVDAGYAGDMDWLADTSRRTSPRNMWPDAKSAIIVAMNYGAALDPLERLKLKDTGVISTYALNRDYHDVIKGRLKTLAREIAGLTQSEVKVFVDTAPLMEKPLAQQAGLGWQGKHTNLISRELGSWFFLGVILTTAELPFDPPEIDHCGSCRACLDICPTQAFPQPYVLDARKCISYLTIEHKGHIAREFRAAMGNRIYGCDDCLGVCPWNKFAQAAREARLMARDDLVAPKLDDLLQLDDAQFRKLFSGSPVKRIGRDRFIRNCLIAAGNSGDKSLVPHVINLLADPSALVRAMAVWALQQLDPVQADQHRKTHETDEAVRNEWHSA